MIAGKQGSGLDSKNYIHRYIEASLDYVRIIEHKLIGVLEQLDNLNK